jgi:hypothetical protein
MQEDECEELESELKRAVLEFKPLGEIKEQETQTGV